MKSTHKPRKNNATGTALRAKARKNRRAAKAPGNQPPANDIECSQSHPESEEGYELNEDRARWDSGKQVGHKI